MRKASTIYIATREEALKLLETTQYTAEGNISQRVLLPKVRLLCAECGKEYIIMGYQFRKKIRQGHFKDFCSRECSQSWESRTSRELHKCVKCGQLCKKGNKYCETCLPTVRGWNKGTGIKPQKRICPVCHQEFLAVHRGKNHFSIYCSMECKNKGHSIEMQGKMNVRFKGYATERRIQAKGLYLLKKEVFKKYHCCVLCNGVKNLQVHHVDLDPANNVISNLVAVCKDCHMEIHRQEVHGEYEQKSLPKIKKFLMQTE